MLCAVLCYNAEDVVCGWTKAEDDAVMEKLSNTPAEAAHIRMHIDRLMADQKTS